MSIMKDYADRTWCKDPHSQAWRDAQIKEWRANNPWNQAKVAISSAYPRIATMFDRVMK